MADYHHSAHAVWDIKYHLVWITKYRYRIVRGEVAERARASCCGRLRPRAR
jgi:REP-associated tyrosine transposase